FGFLVFWFFGFLVETFNAAMFLIDAVEAGFYSKFLGSWSFLLSPEVFYASPGLQLANRFRRRVSRLGNEPEARAVAHGIDIYAFVLQRVLQ
ncbi:MAG: hypothetical protein ACI9JM_001314, partial [Halioglobus sp.]